MYQMLTDEQFKLIQPYFPKPRKPEKIPLKRCMDAICYVLKTGCAWRQMPYDYREKENDWHTIYTRYKRWSESGLFGQMHEPPRAYARGFSLVQAALGPHLLRPVVGYTFE
ncbi:transposase [Candidatus Peregrinibacteria bacterium]|nr:MAG: transposase [Candidatus Peregrinibacteria bacterium]